MSAGRRRVGAALGLLLASAAGLACPLGHADRSAAVRRVFDGDTLELVHGERVRLLGVDAPERGRDGAPDQPYANAATRALAALAPAGSTVQLRLDRERADRYGRTLAHVHTATGRDAQEELLRAGLATLLVLPPNIWQAACLAAAEAAARRERRGLWALPAYQPMAPDHVPAVRHYRVIHGRVTAQREDRLGVTLELDRRMEVWVPQAARPYFPPESLAGRPGQRLEVRGIYQPDGRRPHVVVRHPSALEWRP